MGISPLAASGAAVATLAVLGLAVFACRRWRRRASAAPSPPASSQELQLLSDPLKQLDDINRPLISENLDGYSGPSNNPCTTTVDESGVRANRSSTSPRTPGLVDRSSTSPRTPGLADRSSTSPRTPGIADKGITPRTPGLADKGTSPRTTGFADKGTSPRTPGFADEGTSPRTPGFADKGMTYPTESHLIEGETHVIDVTNGTTEELHLGCTLKRPAEASGPTPDMKHIKRDSREDIKNAIIPVKDTTGSYLALEVIAGPSHGINRYLQSGNTSMLPLTLGRVPQNDLVLKDSEVSGKHAQINWNANTLKWEIVDMGSLNGTFLNSQAVNHPDVGSRRWGEPAELADGDIITLGSTSKVSVQISLHNQQAPVGVGMASDPMIARRTGKIQPMEDVSCCQYPLSGVEQFGLFGIFDGHGGDGAAKAASRLLPENVANILSQQETIKRVLSCCNASEVLKYAFALTEDALNHQYEGCTATALLIWFDQNKDCYAQCANLGDSACIMNVDGEPIEMTEDHRVISTTERARIAKSGQPLKVGESRICGLNLCRMLGDKFLKEQDSRFSSEPYVSPVVRITKSCSAFALIASDGLWDVISAKRAAQLVFEYKERNKDHKTSADKVAAHVLSEARNLRTKDNTSVIFIDFDILRTDP